MTQTLVAYDYVSHDFETVRSCVVGDPKALLVRATSSGSSAELHARLGAIDLGAAIVIEILGVTERRVDFERPTTSVTLAWRAARNPGLFPVMQAVLTLYPLSPTDTQLEISGTYDPPLGVLGAMIDSVALHGFAAESVKRLVRAVGACLRRELDDTAVEVAI